jgi:hypothetical protein
VCTNRFVGKQVNAVANELDLGQDCALGVLGLREDLEGCALTNPGLDRAVVVFVTYNKNKSQMLETFS